MMDERTIYQAAVEIYVELLGWDSANSGGAVAGELMDRAIHEARVLAEKVWRSAGDRPGAPPPEFAEKIIRMAKEADEKVCHPLRGYTETEREWLRQLKEGGAIALQEDSSTIEISLSPLQEAEAIAYFKRHLGGGKDLFLPLTAINGEFSGCTDIAPLLDKMADEGKLRKCAVLLDKEGPIYALGPNFPMYETGEE